MVSDNLSQETIKQQSIETGIDLIEIIDAYLEDSIRLSSDNQDTEFDGNTFRSCEMTVVRSTQDGSDGGETTISIDDADQAILTQLEKIPPVKDQFSTVRYRFILASAPDDVEILEDYELKSFEVDEGGQILLTVAQDDLLSEETPPLKFIPQSHPGLFSSEL